MWEQIIGQNVNAYDYENIAVDNASVKTLTAAKINPSDPAGQTPGQKGLNKARLVLITNDGGAIRYTLNGTTPVTAGGTGHLYQSNDPSGPIIITDLNQMKNFKFIADTVTASTVRVTYMR